MGKRKIKENIVPDYASPYPEGVIQFWLENGFSEEELPYIRIPHDATISEVTKVMAYVWDMRSPKIILNIITGIKYYNRWKNPRHLKAFQEGLLKAANTTEVWFITHGLNRGFSKIVGDAVKEEQARRASIVSHRYFLAGSTVQRYTPLTLIGVVPHSYIYYQDALDGKHEGTITIKNEGGSQNYYRYDLNPDHTHFVVVTDNSKDFSGIINFRTQFVESLAQPINPPKFFTQYSGNEENSSDSETDTPTPITDATIPIVSILIQGGPEDIDIVLNHLKHQMPVVVIKGSGLAADLIGFASEELGERGDTEYEENYIKPELSKKIVKYFPNEFKDNDLGRNKCRDKILECIKFAHQQNRTFLTFFNMHANNADLADLDKRILRSLFLSQTQRGIRWREQLHKDLQLTLDWNKPDLACSEIFQRDDFTKIRVEKVLFEQALLRKNRENFIDLFLDQGFQIHKYLSHKVLKMLFEKAEDQEFFDNACWKGLLGRIDKKSLDEDFVNKDLNWMIKYLCKIQNFISAYELSMNSIGMYVLDPHVAERKAHYALTIWAVLMNRHCLAKLLWKRADEPIPLALIISIMYKKLAKFCSENYVEKQILDNSMEFGQMAVAVLDTSFKESNNRAYGILSEEFPDFNYMTAVEIAYYAYNKEFIAHPCCQKWLTLMFYGDIQVKDTRMGIFSLPHWFKILISALFIFPMYLWIQFIPGQSKTSRDGHIIEILSDEQEDYSEGGKDFGADKEDTRTSLLRMNEINLQKARNKHNISKRIQDTLKKQKMEEIVLPLWKKIFLLWSAPITKFWTFQFFYWIYLGTFSIAILKPTCGDRILDIVVWSWTLLILIELTYRIKIQKQKYRGLPLTQKIVEVILVALFLILFMCLRIIGVSLLFVDAYMTKIFLCFGLLYFYYRIIPIYFPISPTLGPMLVRIKLMVSVDFINFLKMVLLFLISNAIVVHAILWPDYPFNSELLRRAFHRGIFTLFITTYIGDLESPGNNCIESKRVRNRFEDKCPYANHTGDYTDYNCSTGGFFPYFFVLQFLMTLKLVLITLLYALFSNTERKLGGQADAIWKFQRYRLVLDFADRLRLPPPFSIFSYILMICACFCRCLRFIFCSSKCCKRKPKESDKVKTIHFKKLKQSDHYNYWKSVAETYSRQEKEKEEEKENIKKQLECLYVMREDMEFQKINMKRMKDRIVELEKIMMNCRIYLEDVRHLLQQQDVFGMTSKKGGILHIQARQSPYPGTKLQRFPVFDKYVPWESSYSVYDPIIFSLPIAQFPAEKQIFVDIDVLLLKEESDESSEQQKFVPFWNATNNEQLENLIVIVDRRSWCVADDGMPVRYKLIGGVPQNPMGRTGLRGHGSLYRWGPNHTVAIVVTRWRRYQTPEGKKGAFLNVDGRKVLEFIAVKHADTAEWCLPSSFIHGNESIHQVLCQEFMKATFMENEMQSVQIINEEQMKLFFAQFAFDKKEKRQTSTEPLPACSVLMIYKGYIDTPYNTDNAWIEAEVYNIHYEYMDLLDDKLVEPGQKWKEVSSHIKLFANESAIVQEAAKIHDAYR